MKNIMYIDKNNFLCKKVFWQKVCIKVNQISKKDIKKLSEKEFIKIQNTQKYLGFLNEQYDNKILESFLKKEIYIKNILGLYESLDICLDKKIIENYKDIPIKFIYESNKTEWSKIPESELKKIITNNKSSYKNKNEILEVKNSIKAWQFLNNGFIFNKSSIKKLYHILTKWLVQETWEKYSRWFRKVNVIVNNSPTTKFENIEKEMEDLLNYYKKNKKDTCILKLAFDFHLRFEKIHPFENGNWRVWRLIMNKILLKWWFLPIIIFSTNRKAYFNAIKSTEKWNKKQYYKFMLNQYKKTLSYLEK